MDRSSLPIFLSSCMRGRPDYIAPQDLKYVKVDPSPDFDPEHNKQVIEKTIKDNDKLVRERNNEALEKVKERNNALAIYLRSLNMGGKSTDRERFFGRKYLAYLRGKEVMEQLKGQLQIQGRDKVFTIVTPNGGNK